MAFLCIFCNKSFDRKDNRKRHQSHCKKKPASNAPKQVTLASFIASKKRVVQVSPKKQGSNSVTFVANRITRSRSVDTYDRSKVSSKAVDRGGGGSVFHFSQKRVPPTVFQNW